MSEFIMRHFLLCSIPLVSCEQRLNTVGLHGGAAGMRPYTPEAFFVFIVFSLFCDFFNCSLLDLA